jgi:hypothetical protein
MYRSLSSPQGCRFPSLFFPVPIVSLVCGCWRDVIELAVNMYGVEQQLSSLDTKGARSHGVAVHAYRLVYPDNPHVPEVRWEWDKVSIARLLGNATTFGRELAHQSFPTWEAFAEAHQRIWARDYRPRPASAPWET